MVICSTGPPLTALVALAFGLLLASASQSELTTKKRLPLTPLPLLPSSSHPPRPRPWSPPPPPPPPPSTPPKALPPHRGDPRRPPPWALPPTPFTNSPSPRKPRQPPPLLTAKPKRKTHNLGKKVGISFAGIAVIMQFAVAGFLAYKKKQLYRIRD